MPPCESENKEDSISREGRLASGAVNHQMGNLEQGGCTCAQEVTLCYQTSTQTHTDRQTGCAAQTALLHLLCRYLERQRYLTNLGKNSKCPTTFEEFCVHVVHTAPSRRPVSPQLSAPPTTGHTNATPRSPAAPSNCGQHLPSPPPTESRRRRANTFSGSAPSCEQHITGTLCTTPHLTTPRHITPHS